jgi:hypothetical protein
MVRACWASLGGFADGERVGLVLIYACEKGLGDLGSRFLGGLRGSAGIGCVQTLYHREI